MDVVQGVMARRVSPGSPTRGRLGNREFRDRSSGVEELTVVQLVEQWKERGSGNLGFPWQVMLRICGVRRTVGGAAAVADTLVFHGLDVWRETT